MTFYLKYRPQTIEELDLEQVKQSLKKIVKSGNLPHAFLFSGPKGTGKTSAARIIAKVINCEDPPKKGVPCNQCKMCKSITKGDNIDVIEMDAASHRGIDDIRLLRDAVKLSPARAEKKVYIIDEAHMLTTEASNALLKTLEEPPEHVVLILATTNPEKLIGTIRSRTTTIQFHKASRTEIVNSLKKVIKGEKISSDDKSLEVIAEASDGSFRDAQKLLEQLTTELDELENGKVEQYLYGKETHDVDKLIELLKSKKTNEALQMIENVSSSTSIKYYTEKLISRLRSAMLGRYNDEQESIRGLDFYDLCDMIQLFSDAHSKIDKYPIEQLPVELAIVEWCGDGSDSSPAVGEDDEEDNKSRSNGKAKKKSKKKSNGVTKSSSVNSSTASSIMAKGKITDDIDQDVWMDILTRVRPQNASTEALLRAARPIEYDGKTLNIGVYYKFHKEKLEGKPHRDLLENVLEGVLGSTVRIVCTLTEPPAKPEPETEDEVVLTESDDEDIIKVAEEVFGA